MPENERAATTRAQSRQALAQQILRACAVEMRFEDFERRACTVLVHSNEFVERPTPSLTTTVRTPSVTILLGE